MMIQCFELCGNSGRLIRVGGSDSWGVGLEKGWL